MAKPPPQFEDVSIPVSGDIVLTLKRDDDGHPVPLSGPLEMTITFSSPSGSMGFVMKSLRILAARILPPRKSRLSSSLTGYSSHFCEVRSILMTLPQYAPYLVAIFPPNCKQKCTLPHTRLKNYTVIISQVIHPFKSVFARRTPRGHISPIRADIDKPAFRNV